MSDYFFDSLMNLVKRENIENVIESYIGLLSQLTEAPLLSKELFLHNLEEIKKIGDIYVYYHQIENQIVFIGSGTIIFEPKIIRNGKYVGHIEDIVVDSSYRRMGIANKIIEKLVDLSREKCYKIILDCTEDISEFYKKTGFQKRGIQMVQYF